MTVVERTGEIGTLRALGESRGDIVKQFLLDTFSKKELENDFSNGGFIYHYVNDESVGGIPFEFKNGKLHFHKSVKENF